MQQHMTPRKGYNFISLDIMQCTNAKEKEKRVKRTTDWPRMIKTSCQSPKYLLNNPQNHLRTSPSCSQNNHFRPIIQTSEITCYKSEQNGIIRNKPMFHVRLKSFSGNLIEIWFFYEIFNFLPVELLFELKKKGPV